MKNLNKTTVLLVIILAMALIAMFRQYTEIHSLTKEAGDTNRQLMRKNKELLESVAASDQLRGKLEEREKYWLYMQADLRDSLKTAQINTSSWRKKYEKLKNTPVPDWSNADLDSLLESIIR